MTTSSTDLETMFKNMMRMVSTTLETSVKDHLSYRSTVVRGSKGVVSMMEASGVNTGMIHVTADDESTMRMIQLMTVINRTNVGLTMRLLNTVARMKRLQQNWQSTTATLFGGAVQFATLVQ
eukprot:3107710-Amphidinium_carterae.1